ncbi:MAG: AAA family ATPase [Deltaproteobacteria bacterium]|nr:AAA family ATPase [Deltaproteobacteria bacterium]
MTVLFSDLSGYTAMSEKLDPEEVKEITSRIFGKISQVIAQYSGFIEKYIGDAVMAVFGVPKAQEDDPVRAIKAAREINDVVRLLSPQYISKIGEPLAMHTGINTGLVVTGEVNLKEGTHGLAGDPINVAARLSGLAGAGEIVVGYDTYLLAQGHFVFEALKPATLKGKIAPVQAYKAVRPKEAPSKVHRLHGLRSELIGRNTEMQQLAAAVEHLTHGRGNIISICGEAGTGKSRLVEEFKTTLDYDHIQWIEGHAYAYTQNRPYAIIIDLLRRAFSIDEGHPPQIVRQKLETSLEFLVGKEGDAIPYLGSLFSLSYPEVEDISPEFWKSKLQESAKIVVAALARAGPLVICLEDLHWADPSSIDLMHHLLAVSSHHALFVCVYRPVFTLFTPDKRSNFTDRYSEIDLHELSHSETQEMAVSLLRTDAIPTDLSRIIQEKSEGNPFYLEEVINSLIESEVLVKDHDSWKLTRPVTETDIPSTIQGVLTARFDRLEKDAKRILQEASVIGRAFFYEILKRITDLKNQMDQYLGSLEALDLIRTRALEPDIEYIFKHALTQEVVYNGLLKKERQEIHERIGQSMELIFHDRISEFFEALSFHFSRGKSLLKAVDYLAKSSEKALKRFALEEAHAYCRQAFELLNDKKDRTLQEDHILLDLILKWALVYNHKGDFKGLHELLMEFEHFAVSLGDKPKLGMYYAWLGFILCVRGKAREGYSYLSKSLALGEETNDFLVIAYACTWLTWTCWDLGLLDEARRCGERAQELQRMFFPENHYIHFSSLGGLGHICSATGESKKALEIGEKHLAYSRKHSDVRSAVFGYIDLGFGYFIAGDFGKAVASFNEAYQTSPDPFFAMYAQFWFGASYLMENRADEAEVQLQEVLRFVQEYGTEIFENSTIAFLGVVSILKGGMKKGMEMLKKSTSNQFAGGRRSIYALLEHTLGNVYLQIAKGEGPKSFSFMLKNIGFLFKSIPFAKRYAETHFNRAIKISREIGAKFTLAAALMDLGNLNKIRKRSDEARRNLTEAAQLFEECGADEFLKQTKKALESV